ncbi:hypothetical protein [Dethiothermospora halolimnae]|uniref:hypothetical protein n=1 Tax=Dethiothermospora halolimnae TaxID=3114390 RepID=UPI003CCC4407
MVLQNGKSLKIKEITINNDVYEVEIINKQNELLLYGLLNDRQDLEIESTLQKYPMSIYYLRLSDKKNNKSQELLIGTKEQDCIKAIEIIKNHEIAFDHIETVLNEMGIPNLHEIDKMTIDSIEKAVLDQDN